MFYEEKVISGILHWRSTPEGEWTAKTAEQLSEKIIEKDVQIQNLLRKIEMLENFGINGDRR